MSRQGKPCALHPMPWSQHRAPLLPPCSTVQPGSAVPAAPAFLLLPDPRLPTGVCCPSAWSQCTRSHSPRVPPQRELGAGSAPRLPASLGATHHPKTPHRGIGLCEAGPRSVPHLMSPELPSCGGAECGASDTGMRGTLGRQGKPAVPPKMLWQCCPQLWDRQGSRLTAHTGTPSHRRQDTLPGQNQSRSPWGHAEPQRWGQPRTRTQHGSAWVPRGHRDSGTSSSHGVATVFV